ncbi:hypothetical protein QTH97_23940 [Variovorax sp. J22R24]|uniref:LPD7 domain-containing protein n=1 Tax=Variovorax gracilis TaxID=3053502 RepID=UPI002574CE9D|nr:LPD7 domain-containing protein [Variovorax sp. J22R24]MDM0108021.1 hypothetical protein [Variovorax sp. J22R24]
MANADSPDRLRPASDGSAAAASSSTSGPASWEFAGSVIGDAPPLGRSHVRAPDGIERRYLKVDNRYFFPDRTLAFIDDGNRIRVRTENLEVLHSVVAIAEARGWRVIEVRGTEAFRQAIWREAAMRRIDARGYDPTEVEVRQVQRRLSKKEAALAHDQFRAAPSQATKDHTATEPDQRQHTAVGNGPQSNPIAEPARGADSEDTGASRPPRATRDGARPPIRGILVAAAAAPYQFDPAQRMSFYVAVHTEVGDRTIWGADLERALAESASQPRIGEQVILTQQGTRPVNVRVPHRNAEGELMGDRKIVAQRARWSIETPDHVREIQRRAQWIRSGQWAGESVDQRPELAAAAAGLKLAEQFARRVTSDAPSQERLLHMIRERMAAAMEQGRHIILPGRRSPPSQSQLRRRTGRSYEELTRERP